MVQIWSQPSASHTYTLHGEVDSASTLIMRRWALSVFIPVFFASLLYVSWLIFGLRNITSDDAMLSLIEKVYHGRHFEISGIFARSQSRILFYPKMMIAMYTYALYNSPYYDAINISAFIVFWLSLFLMISRLFGTAGSMITSAFCVFMFPLHFFYTVPQGYGISEYYGIVLLFLSVWMFLSVAGRNSIKWTYILSVLLFTISLTGTEFNFVLAPALIVVATFFLRISPPWRFKLLLPYAIALLGVTLANMFYAAGHQVTAHTKIALHPFLIIETFLKFEEKAFIPLGLWSGILLMPPPGRGVPNAPGLIDYGSLLATTEDFGVLSAIFLAGVAVFGFGLYWQTAERRTLLYVAIISSAIAVIPVGLISVTEFYQGLVPQGYVQGHIATLPAQLGLAILVWTAAVWITNLFARYRRLVAASVCGILLSLMTTSVFLYNNINRQAMNASMQRWAAFDELVKYLNRDRSDILDRPFYIPEFSYAYSVSNATGPSSVYSEYWDSYASIMLGKQIKVVPMNAPDVGDSIRATYFPTPLGFPVVVMLERPSSDHPGRLTLISQARQPGTLSYARGQERVTVALSDLACEATCILTQSLDLPVTPETISVDPAEKGPSGLIGQLLLSRHGAFGNLAAAR